MFLRLTHVASLGTIAHLLTTEYSIVFMDHIFLNHPSIDTQHHCVLNEHVSSYWQLLGMIYLVFVSQHIEFDAGSWEP